MNSNQNKKQINVTPIYAEKTAYIIEELDKHIVDQTKDREPDDYNKSLLGLWYIIKQNIFFVVSNANKVYWFYPVAGSVRLIMECVADAKHLQNHPVEATQYFYSQKEVQEQMKALGKNRFNLFKSGDISAYGKLSKQTLARIKKAHGSDGLGAYSFLCCFSHPNIAGAFWFAGDTTKGLKNLYVVEIMNASLAAWIKILEESSQFDIDAKYWINLLTEVHKQTLALVTFKEQKK